MSSKDSGLDRVIQRKVPHSPGGGGTTLHHRRVEFDRKVGEVVIPMIAFIERGMTVPMGRITRDYLPAHRLCPHQCAPNFFRVLGSIDALDRHLGLGLTWHDVAHLYEGHIESRAGFYLKSRSSVVKLISCHPKSNKGMKDDYLILSGPGVTA